MNDLLTKTWWAYAADSMETFDVVFHWFNIAEGIAWLICSTFVFARFLKNRKSRLEPLYAIAFLTFGFSDFREAWIQSTPLILFKAINVVILFRLRWVILKNHYPKSKIL